MRLHIIILFLLLPLIRSAAVATNEATEYLERYGYLAQSARYLAAASGGTKSQPQTHLSESLKKFQKLMGIDQTGELDSATKTKMAGSRCGVEDVPDIASLSSGPDRWTKHNLTYSIDNTDSGLPERETRTAIRKAFALYAALIPLTFQEVSHGVSDIKLRFGRGRHAGCPYVFNKTQYELAHAFYPRDGGGVHFNADYRWTIMNANHRPDEPHKDFLTTAIHEIGHSLGYHQHSDDPSSIMAPYYLPPVDANGNYVTPTLDDDTISRMQGLYGTVQASEPEDGEEDTPDASRACVSDVYAALSLPGHLIMLFTDRGTKITLFNGNRKAIQRANVSQVFSDAPSFVAAAFYSWERNMFMLFNGNQVWGYSYQNGGASLADGYPKRLPVDEDWKTGGAWYSGEPGVIVSYSGTVARYNADDHTIDVKGPISQVYPSMPKDTAGSAMLSHGVFGYFTASKLFKYDYNKHSTHDLGDISDHFEC